MKKARHSDRRHTLAIHALGVLLMFSTTALILMFSLVARDLWAIADEYGKGMYSGAVIAILGLLIIRGYSRRA